MKDCSEPPKTLRQFVNDARAEVALIRPDLNSEELIKQIAEQILRYFPNAVSGDTVMLLQPSGAYLPVTITIPIE